MHVHDISWWNLSLVGLGLIPVSIAAYFMGLRLIKPVWISSVRMVLQLVFVGLYLELLFRWNSPIINLVYLFFMIAASSSAVINRSPAQWKKLIVPMYFSTLLCFMFFVVLFNTAIVGFDKLFDARYLIPLGGMLLGNSLKSNVIAMNTFMKSIKEDEAYYFQRIGFGAKTNEALRPFVLNAVKSAFQPTIASTATIGLVALPGMMTGQVLAGSSPMLAIKYQIAIVLGILTNAFLSITMTVFVLTKIVFDRRGVLRKEIYKKEKSNQRRKKTGQVH